MFSWLQNEDSWNVSDGNTTWAWGASANIWSAELPFAPQPPRALLSHKPQPSQNLTSD